MEELFLLQILTNIWELHLAAMLNGIYILTILLCIYKHVLRKLKYNLEKLYLVFIRPIFEYACEVWDNCGVGNSNKLDQLQLEAAIIGSGLPIFASSILIYKELGWESLVERRQRRKLQMFYNIQNNNPPMYLCDLIPSTIQSTTVYPLRNGSDIIIPFCRLSNTYYLCIPSTIRQWNSLDPPIRNVDSIAKFKTELRKRKEIGPRKLNIILTQLRCFASSFELRFVPSKYSLRPVLSLWCQSRRLLSFPLRLFSLFKYKTYIVSKSQLDT